MKKFIIFWETSHFSVKARKVKENPHRENFLYSEKMELPSSNIKKLHIFSQKKAFHIFQQIEFSNPKNKRVQERTSEHEK